MAIQFKNFRSLLVLANRPKNVRSILDWCPFTDGRSLYNIIKDHNDKCIKAYLGMGWLPDFIQDIGEGVRVERYDFSEIEQLDLDSFKDIDIILIDHDAIKGKSIDVERKLVGLKTKMGTVKKPYILLQISKTPKVDSIASYFEPLAISRTEPEIFYNEKEFEDFLTLFCRYYFTGARKYFAKRHATGEDTDNMKSSLKQMASFTRDIAFAMNMSPQKVNFIASRAANNDLFLKGFAESKLQPVILDALAGKFGPNTFKSDQNSLAQKEVLRSVKKSMADRKNFALRDREGNEIGVYTGINPRQAAMKVANRGYTDIRLRERGTKKVHIFVGERVQVGKPAEAPAWMSEKIWKPNVKKVGIEKLERI